MSDFRTVLIEDSRIADITSTEVFGVQSSASQSTYQQFQAVSASNSSITFNVQVPSENIVIDRHLLLATRLRFQLGLTNVPPLASAFQYGLTDALQAFPLNSLFTTIQTTINNVSVSTNLQDVLPMLMRMSDRRVLSRYNSMTPSLPDCSWGEYRDGVGSNSNPLASYDNASYDESFEPRGAYKLNQCIIEHVIAAGGTDSSVISTNLADVWRIYIEVDLTEPFLALSPFINCEPDMNAGLVGVNNMSMVLNVDSTCKRLFSTANTQLFPVGAGPYTGLTSYINSIQLGWSPSATAPLGVSSRQGFTDTRLLFNFLSLQPEQYAKISTKNVVPYVDYPRYLSTFNSSVIVNPQGANSNASSQTVLTSQSIQLNQIPDLILICARVPMTTQNQCYSSSFLCIDNISVNFNNASGLLASARPQDLYNISVRNGSSQSYYEFQGQANVANGVGNINRVATTGSLLVLNPVYDFSLPSYLSASSLGQYQFQFNLTVRNQYDFQVAPEICIITMNSGIFATQQGTSQIFTGILTKEQVLKTKEQNPVPHLGSAEYKRMVGGKLANRGMGNVMKKIHSAVSYSPMDGIDDAKHLYKSAKHSMGAGSGGGFSGGAGGMSGGSLSYGKSKSKLAKHFA